MFINKVKIIALLSLISILMVGCNKKAEEKTNEKSLESITISGSTSVGPLMEKESEIVVVSREEGSGTRDAFRKSLDILQKSLLIMP